MGRDGKQWVGIDGAEQGLKVVGRHRERWAMIMSSD